MSTENNLWMGDIKPWMDESFILSAFNYYNINPLDVKLIHDRNTNELKNFCFINFENLEEANKCLIMLNGKQIPNTPENVSIKFKLNWANHFSTFNKSVYVGNLSPDVDDISLYNLFKEKYSTVHHASVITDKGKSKGYGFILFGDEKDYERCLNEMNGILFHGNIIKVNEQRKKYDDIKNNRDNIDKNINNFNNNNHHHQNKKNNHEQNSLNNLYNLNKIKAIKSNNINNNININSQLQNNNINNINNYQTDANSLIQNNSNNPKIISNIINKVKNINYYNDINNNLYNKNNYNNDNTLNPNRNNISNSLNNNINLSMLDMQNHPSLFSNNVYSNNNNENETNIINNNNQIISNNLNIINNLNNNAKKDNISEYDLEIFNKYDNGTLKKKISENLEKMYNYYMDVYPGDINKLRCK